jgi:hypothetical protein
MIRIAVGKPMAIEGRRPKIHAKEKAESTNAAELVADGA